MTKRDYYEILGVTKDATDAKIKKSYRELARKHHPDLNPDTKSDAEEKFKEVSEAYEVLMDKDKRARYDQFGHSGVFNQGAGGFQWSDFTHYQDVEDIFGDFGGSIFNMFFGGNRRSRRTGPKKGNDLRYDITISLKNAFDSIERTINMEKMVVCPECKGSRSKSGSSPSTCHTCNGSGQVQKVRATPFGQFATITTCDSCHGSGQIINDPCLKCRGKGSVRGKKKIKVKIPAGIEDGSHIRIPGEGNPSTTGGPSGDLYIVVHIKNDSNFYREGTELLYDQIISFPQATLGDTITVNTIDGKVQMKIPAGTRHGKVLRLKGKGMPDLRTGRRGDQHVRIFIDIPTSLSEEQKDLIRKLGDSFGKTPAEEKKGFFKNLGF